MTWHHRPKIHVTLTRESVCAGDDCWAPHEKTVEVDSLMDPAAFARQVATGYLPSVQGTGHSWTCILNDVSIAEISVFDVRALVSACPFQAENRVHFDYHSAMS